MKLNHKIPLKYKALILDVDGTTVHSRGDALPSKKVKNAIHEANKVIKVCLATGRPHYLVKRVARELKINQPCVFEGGSEIRNPATNEIFFRKFLTIDKQKEIVNNCLPFGYDLYGDGTRKNNGKITSLEQVTKETGRILVEGVEGRDVNSILQKLTAINGIASHPTSSWSPGNVFDIHITHAEATKRHAIEKLLEIIDIKAEEVIGVGDSYNDLPLLASVGLKVAMGNAPNEVKDQAHYITASLDDDGVAQVIQEFIMSKIN